MNHAAFVLPGIDRIGGAERQVLQLAKGLHQRGWRVTLIALSGTGGDAGRELIAAGVNFLSLGMRRGLADPAGWLRYRKWIRREAPDVVHAHLPHAAWMARWSRLFAPVRVVVDTVHTSACGTLGRRLGYRYSDFLADSVSAVSAGAADAYASAGMVSANRLLVIPNGVDTSCWKPDPRQRRVLRAELGMGDEFLWLAAGRLEPVKNYPALLDAFAKLPETAHLIIAGTGRMETELRRQCSHLNMTARVIFAGFEPNLLRWMRAADAFVLPSLWEGLPMVLLEAAACSLPAAATDVSGSRDVLLHGQTGLLVEPGNVTALAKCMETMMRLDPAVRAAMGRNARQRIVEHFSLESVIDRWEIHYRELLSNRSGPSRTGKTSQTWPAMTEHANASDATSPAIKPAVHEPVRGDSATLSETAE
jgi:glycosyltransferase involved in cell wall biosynthesis